MQSRGAGGVVTALAAELAAVTGERCGHSCAPHNEGREHTLACERDAGHAGATQLVDMHIGHDEHATIIGFRCECDGQ